MHRCLEAKSVLVVEDDVHVLQGLEKRLLEAGFAVLTARRAEEALELAREQRPDAMTLDVRLPDFDGLELAAILSENPATARIPIVFISGKVDRQLRDTAEADSARFFIHKPYDPALLVRLLKSVLAGDELAEIRSLMTAKRRQPVS